MQSLLEDLQELATMPIVKAVLAALWYWVLEMVGHPESAARWLFYLMIADLLLGFGQAWKQNDIRGQKLKGGAFKFFRYWIAVAVFVMADAALIKAFPAMPVSLRDTFIAYLAINEAFSCIDHLSFFGMPVPEGFLRRLRNYRDGCVSGEWNGAERRISDKLGGE
jgi:phage-related holin